MHGADHSLHQKEMRGLISLDAVPSVLQRYVSSDFIDRLRSDDRISLPLPGSTDDNRSITVAAQKRHPSRDSNGADTAVPRKAIISGE